jgi:hypothetical protein
MINNYTYIQTVILGGLKNLITILEKGKAYAAEKGIAESELLDAKLYDDMFPFAKQVQIASDNAKGGMAKLSGTAAPVMADTEASFDELVARVQKTIDYVATFNEASFVNADSAQITFPWMPGKYISSADYINTFLLNNFFFHMTTAYDVLRNKGVQLAKTDYIGNVTFVDIA